MAQAANPYGTPRAAVGEAAAETQPVSLFAVSGRIGRMRYIAYGVLVWLVLSFVAGILAAVLGPAGVYVALAAWVPMLVLGFMLTIQRCHDFDTSGWLSILFLVPLANLIFWFIPGSDGPNRYGPPTPPNGAAVIIGACVVPVVLVLFVGVLAAVAIPAYGDYTKRAQISGVIASAMPLRQSVAEHYVSTQKLPASLAELGRNAPPPAESRQGRVSLGENGVITLTLSSELGDAAGRTLLLRPQAAAGNLSWDCTGGTLQPKYRRSDCRAP